MMDAINLRFPSTEELTRNPKLKITESGKCQILQAQSYEVSRFSELVYLTSLLSYCNREHFLLYRGQSKQHKTSDDTLSFLPNIFRDRDVKGDFTILKRKASKLLTLEDLKGVPDEEKEIIAWSLIQHYEMAKTPLLDLTQSLRVAYSIATDDAKKKGRDYVYIYVFALPFSNGYILEKDDIILVRLLSICPPFALRPQFQEGYLVRYNTEESYDFNKYLVAEIKISCRNLLDCEKFNVIHPASLVEYPNDEFSKKVQELFQNK